ncbi:NAD(P) transhydrogenase subunit alpha [Gelatiniphilus marinus]|uniref:proton-translocating NAD(P)(+) transhydrogenase n=1 Tax=Gelatiniphilus marinus TaxID=1759464 RepID=A0ABW5JPM3_9FLAO
MVIGVLKEWFDNKVGLVPAVVKKLIAKGYTVQIETKSGRSSYIANADFEAAGAIIKERDEIFKSSDILISFTPIKEEEYKKFKKGVVYISNFKPYIYKDVAEKLQKYEIQAFSLDMIPRSSIAQSMDVLSSMSSIAGYKAVLKAADLLPRYFPMLITSAGSVKPAKVLVIGAGVAGLQAIATAKRIGAIVEAVDTRLETEDEVKSLGGKFLKVEGANQSVSQGYGSEQTDEFIQKQREMMFKHITEADVIICTATVRSTKAPVIVTKEMVENMRRGSVIIDLASDAGGNCELTEDGKSVIHNYVHIIGNSNLSDGAVVDASTLFANNIYNFLNHISDSDLKLKSTDHDEIYTSSCISNCNLVTN